MLPSRVSRALCALLPLLFAAPATRACTTISATTITSNTTWGPTGLPADSCYVISNTITISAAATLTIQPGTVLYFASGTSLVVGGTSTAGQVYAVGTDTAPVVFTALNAQHGGWAGLDFRDYSDFAGASSFLDHCVIKKAGGSGTSGAAIKVTSSSGLTLQNSLVTQYRNYGIDLSTAPATVYQCVFSDSIGTYPVTGSPRDVQAFFAYNTFVAKGKYDAIRLKAVTTSQSVNLTLPPSGFCYTFETGESVVEGSGVPVMAIASGSVLKFPSGARLLVGVNTTGGLQATSVVFTSTLDDTISDTPGDGATSGAAGQWRCVLFGTHTDATSVLDHCTIRYAGATDNAGLRLQDPVMVSGCLIEKNTGYGIMVEGGGVTEGNVYGNLVRENSSYEVFAPPLAMASLVAQNTIAASSNGKLNAYLLQAGTVPASVTLPRPVTGFCYLWETGESPVEGSSSPILAFTPGTVVKFPANARLLVGVNDGGGLQARGVVFTSSLDDTIADTPNDGLTTGAAGQWRCLVFGTHSLATSYVDSCVIRYGGATDNAGLRLQDPVSVSRCIIEKNTGYGIMVEGGAVTEGNVTGNTIRDNTSYEVLAPPVAMASLVAQNTIAASSNGKLNAYLLQAGTVPSSVTLPRPVTGFCYLWETGESPVEGSSSPILGFTPGTVVKFPAGARLLVGVNDGGGLQARGVVFTSSLDDTIADTPNDGPTTGAAGQWRCLVFGTHTLAPSYVDSCVIRYAGATDNAGLRLQDPVSVTRCVIESNTGYGISVEGSSVSADGVQGNLVRNNSSYEVTAPPVGMAGLIAGNTIVASGTGKYDGYYLQAGTVPLSVTLPVPRPGFCYVFEGGESPVEGSANPTLAFLPGTVVKCASSTRLLVGPNSNGGLVAKGVTFTSTLDDTIADTPGDGVTSGAPGQWRGLYFGSHMNGNTALSCSQVRFAGATNSHGIEIGSASPSFAYCTILSNTGDGIYANGSSAHPSVYGCTIRGNTDAGIDLVSNATATVRRTNLAGNTAIAIRTNSTTVTVDALNNWWGNASGPSDASAGPPDQNAGTGALVSDYVAFRPWLSGATTPECDLALAVESVRAIVDVSSDRVELHCDGRALEGALVRLERSEPDGTWRVRVERPAVASSFTYLDEAVTPGSRLGYRVSVIGADGTSTLLAERWVDVPAAARLAWLGARPNPSLGASRLCFTLADRQPARLEVFDVAGRRARHVEIASPSPGMHTVSIADAGPLAPGLYLVRLCQGSAVVGGQFVVIH